MDPTAAQLGIAILDDPSQIQGPEQHYDRHLGSASAQAAGRRQRRFLELGLEGLHHELRPGRPRT